MCSIVGSFDTDTAKELCSINSYRGSLNHSITYLKLSEDRKFLGISVNRYQGPLDISKIEIPENHYAIIHQQAPTQQSKYIHPAEAYGSFLWHNGILKENTVKKIQAYESTNNEWDTYLLLLRVVDRDFSDLDGSFACLFYECGKLYAFRNEISPLFYDKDLNLSSTKFDGCDSLPPGHLFSLDFHDKTPYHVLAFETVENPYWFGDE